ncbi:MAG: DUF308 domain-containing protein [Clostridia bacterium]|nr:DUF308 domain-containing protein [Clostridia bacterium]
MEDDEEYSYAAYSADTKQGLRRASIGSDDEELAYTGYADAELAEEEREERVSYGDFIIEEFSSEVNVPRVAKITRIPQGIVKYIFAAIYLAAGVSCVVLTDTVQYVLPYIVGAAMCILGLGRFIIALANKEYRTVKTNQTAMSLIIVALGVMIIIENDWALEFISIIWGVLGLFETAHALNHAFSKIAASESCITHIIKALLEGVLAFMLLYEPSHHISLHIMVFGINLIIDAIFMLPVVKRRLNME